MRTRLVLTASVFLAGAYALPSHAQSYNKGYNDSVIRCESRDNRTERCAVGGGGDIRLVRQLSSSPCVRGRNWGTDSRGIWVSGGCRAEFSVGGYGNGYGNNGRYNNGGSDLIRCESNDNRSRSCNFTGNSRGDIRLLRQLSGKPCIENKTWGRSRNGVWVTQGCRAEFVIGGRGNGGRNTRPPGVNVRPPGDLGGGVPGGQQPGALQPGVFQNTSGREDNSQRPPVQTVVERPRGYQDNSDVSGGRQIRPVEQTQPAAPVRPVAQVELRDTGRAAQPGVVERPPGPRSEPAPRERDSLIQRGERPH